MAKKFMFVCVGILALTVAFLLGAQFGRAEYVDHSATGLIAACYGYDGFTALSDNGQVWSFGESLGNTWAWVGPWADLPIPVSQVKFFIGRRALISINNELWARNYYDTPWVNYGPPPGGLATEPSTWGQIKAQFGK